MERNILKNEIVVIIILSIVSIFFRFYRLGNSPQGLYLDEAAIGYNALSVLKTGKDEFGKNMPIVFRSFTDFKAPVYTYILVPILAFFELNSFWARLPSAFFGVLTVICLYKLILLVYNQSDKHIIAFLSCLFLAVSPWHIIFSRTTYETNLALFFLIFGVYLYYLSLDSPKYFIGSICVLVVSSLTYHAERLIAPLLFLFLVVVNWGRLSDNFKRVKWIYIGGIVIAFLLALPSLLLFNTPGFLSRVSTLNIFSTSIQLPYGYINNYSGALGHFVNNTRLLHLYEFASLYVSYFSPRQMFNLGDYGPRSSYPDLATFFVWQFPLYILGMYTFIRDSRFGEIKKLMLYLLFLSPIPAAMTRDPYSTIRSLPMSIPLVFIMAVGGYEIYKKLEILNFFKYCLFIFLIGISFTRLYISIFLLNDYFRSKDWEYGYKQASDYVFSLDPKLPILVDNSRGEPYIHFLFNLKFDPKTYQEENFEVSNDEYYTNMNRRINKKMGRIEVRQFSWATDTLTDKYIVCDQLAISDDQIEKHNMVKIKEIYYPDNTTAFKIIRTMK